MSIVRPPEKELVPALEDSSGRSHQPNGVSPAPPGSTGADMDDPPRSVRSAGGAPRTILALAGACVAAGLVLRFWTRSDLWLDEALSVNIAALPLGKLHAALHQDGAPPLYYVLLHFWIRAFGTSNIAVRSLSGLIGVVTLPVAYVAGTRVGGRRVGSVALLLVATSPFAIRYSTETRMYSLVMLEAFLGILAIHSVRRSPRWWNLAATALLAASLLYTHYWSIYLIAATAAMLALFAYRRDRARESLAALGAVVAGSLLFIPWLPTFFFQLLHTGTPWSQPVNFTAMVNAVSEFAGGISNEGRALGLIFFALAGIGLFGIALDSRRIELDLKTQPRARAVAMITVVTLALAILVGIATRSGFQARYASVVYPTFILLVALASLSFVSDRIRWGVVGAALVFGLIGSAANVTTDRTQATAIASYINAHAHPGDVVAYCPDQLGPDTSRLLRGNLQQVTFPRAAPPARVDWIDYANTIAAASTRQFAQHVLSLAGPHRTIYFAWASGYVSLRSDCQAINAYIYAARPDAVAPVIQNSVKYYEFASLYVYSPPS